METNFTTLDSRRINKNLYARLLRVKDPQRPDDFVVATYKDTGNPTHGPVFYISQMCSVEHFSDEQEATQYFLALMDPGEFGDPRSLISCLKSRDPSKSYKWRPSADVAKAIEAESFRREVAR